MRSYALPLKRLVTEPFSKTSRIVCANRARSRDREVRELLLRADRQRVGRDDLLGAAVGQALSSRVGEDAVGGGDDDVARAGVLRTLTAPAIVPPVSIMSSSARRCALDVADDAVGLHLVGHQRIAGLVDERQRCTVERIGPLLRDATRPNRGDDADVVGAVLLADILGELACACMWSTGPSKKPWIWSVVQIDGDDASAPAVFIKSAMRRAEIGSRPRCFLSWRA